MTTKNNLPIACTAADRASMERQLNDAVAVARAQATTDGRQQILVTRHGYSSFAFALGDAAPPDYPPNIRMVNEPNVNVSAAPGQPAKLAVQDRPKQQRWKDWSAL